MGQVIWSEPAYDDLRDITEFIAKVSPVYAERLNTRITRAPRGLRDWPRSGGRVPEFDCDHIRELIIRPYRLIYVVRDDDCYITAVIHGSRDLTLALRSRDLDP